MDQSWWFLEQEKYTPKNKRFGYRIRLQYLNLLNHLFQKSLRLVQKMSNFFYNLVVWNLQYFVTFLLLLQIFLQNNPLLQFELALLLCCISFKSVCRILDKGYSIKYRVRRQYHVMIQILNDLFFCPKYVFSKPILKLTKINNRNAI